MYTNITHFNAKSGFLSSVGRTDLKLRILHIKLQFEGEFTKHFFLVLMILGESSLRPKIIIYT